jgi:hypothetical protein
LVTFDTPLAELAAYARERMANLRIAVLVAVLAGLGFAVEPPTGALQAAIRVALVALLVVQFRLWDDIADREHDRQRYPERVLQRHAGRASAFLALLGLLSVPIVLLLLTFRDPEWRIAAYGVLAAALAVVYGSHATAHGRVMRMGWVLLKYPVFVLLVLDDPANPSGWVAAAVSYLGVMFHDWATSTDAADMRRAQLAAPRAEATESVACYACGASRSAPFLNAEDDLSGRPQRFAFVRCRNCRLTYLDPRLKPGPLAAYVDADFVARHGRADWGWLTPLYLRLMGRHDRNKAAFLARHVTGGKSAEVLEVDLQQGLGRHAAAARRYEVIAMWNVLERDYDPAGTLRTARDLLAPGGRIVIEVPCLGSLSSRLFHERWPGLQAPRNTALYTRQSLESMVEAAGLEVVEHFAHGAFPPYLYFFAGAAFQLLKGRAVDARLAIVPFVVGRVLFFPVSLLSRRLNLATQTVVCRLRWEPPE